MPKKTSKNLDLHIYLTPEDAANLKKAKGAMIALGIPESAIGQQDVIRYALRKAAQ